MEQQRLAAAVRQSAETSRLLGVEFVPAYRSERVRIADCGVRNEVAKDEVRNEVAETYPWESPEADLEAAEKLINDCGYHRRDEELADAKKALLGQE